MALDQTKQLLNDLFHGLQASYQQIDAAAIEVKEARRLLSQLDHTTTVQVQDPTPTDHDTTLRLLGESLAALVCLIGEMREKGALTAVTSETASLILAAREHLRAHHHEAETLGRYERVSFRPLEPKRVQTDPYPPSDEPESH